MTTRKQGWDRLVAAARRWRDERESAAPAGFATRVAALGLAAGGGWAALFERLAPRALGLATVMMALALTWNLMPVTTAVAADYHEIDLLDPVGEVLALVVR